MKYPDAMKGRNQSTATEFILLGYSGLPNPPVLLFVMVLVTYMIILLGNILIILITLADPGLHTPMYFFLRILSFLEICFTAVTIPEMLVKLLAVEKSISFSRCAAQMYFLISVGGTECCLLAIMAYDRYVAICHPLLYTSIMNKSVCLQLVGVAWLSSNLVTLMHVTWLFNLPFCTSNQIDHFFCDAPPVLELVCGNTYMIEIEALTSTVVFVVIPFLLIFWSYLYILTTILKMPSAAGRRKTFSTCSSHLTVVVLSFSTTGLTYFQPKSSISPSSSKFWSICYTVLTPLLNPVVYTLRNNEVKGALRRIFCRLLSSWGQL
ncbi:olfactory receptor 10A4-like [Carettochelys insculpta]|uniref:olfactory receptor 10A4-like n=1 Tax=Carettochelys insculpta TaxID=44489 RepID=UPI003EC0C810